HHGRRPYRRDRHRREAAYEPRARSYPATPGRRSATSHYSIHRCKYLNHLPPAVGKGSWAGLHVFLRVRYNADRLQLSSLSMSALPLEKTHNGSVAEWLKAPVLKTGKGQPFVSSNLTASARVRLARPEQIA